ncbi:Uncharacterised protein [Amycolatopsis camponoti]|uniref:Uncharacterized protein n=1 Tax=Amycolatopsis camponoti TaxID=2606593 RepID=A0A6I8LQ83_9PSEU|nr:Uncharacterised protein [Amycolatopsis camponoti]
MRTGSPSRSARLAVVVLLVGVKAKDLKEKR